MKSQPIPELRLTDGTFSDTLRLQAAVEEYLAALDGGASLSRSALLEKYSPIRTELLACLESLDFIRNAAGSVHFQPPGESSSTTIQSWNLGEYRVQSEIGRGGMGIVYRAEQITLGRQVALKVLPLAALLDERQLKRFRNEARAAALLKHPHIVSVFSVGCERGVHYYAMELIEGQSLAEIIQARNIQGEPTEDTTPLAALSTHRSSNRKRFYRDVARLGIQAAGALHFAHQHSVVHRDVKPSNLLIDRDSNLHVADFGLAQVQAGDELTFSGDLVGTLRYMSPEQWQGTVTDARTDVHGLGLTLFELIAGSPAHQGQSRQAIMKHVVDGQPRRLDRVDRRVPQDLATIVHKAMQRDPEDRYQTAALLADDLQRFLDRRTILARPARPHDRLWRSARRNPLVSSLVALVACLLITLAAGSAAIAWRSTKIAQRQELAIFARDIRLAHQAASAGDHLEAERILLRWVPTRPGDDEDPRGYEWHYVWSLSHDPALERSITYEMPVFDISISPTGDQLAVGWFSKQVDLWDLRQSPLTKPERRPKKHTFGVYAVRRLNLTPDIVVGDSNGQVVIWKPDGSEFREKPVRIDAPRDQNAVHSVDVSDDDRRLAVGAGNLQHGSVHVWDRALQSWLVQQQRLPGRGLTAFGPEGELIVACERSDQLLVHAAIESKLDTDSAADSLFPPIVAYAPPDSYKLQSDRVAAMAVSPNRAWLAVVTHDTSDQIPQIELWDTGAWLCRRRIPLSHGAVRCAQFSQDGAWISVGHEDGALAIFEVESGRLVIQKQMHTGKITDIVFSDDSSRLVTSGTDGSVHIWRLASLRKTAHTITTLADDVPTVFWSARFVAENVAAVSSSDGRILLWDTATGQLKQQFQIDNGDATMVQLAVAPNRRFIGVTCGHWPPPGQATSPLPGKAFILDVESNEIQAACEIPAGTYYSLSSFSADSHLFALCSYEHVLVLDVETGRVLKQLSFGNHVKHVAFSPDGQWLACSITDGHVQMLDAQTFETRYKIRTDSRYSGDVSFSPNSQMFATVGWDRKVRLFAADDGRSVGPEFPSCATYLATVAFAPDGKRLVTGAMDGKVRLWHVESGEELLNFEVPKSWYPSCSFSANGSTLVVGCGPLAQAFVATAPDALRRLSVAELNELSCAKAIHRPKFLAADGSKQ